MTADDLPTPLHYTGTAPTPDQLGALCRAQMKMIQSLRDDLKHVTACNAKLSGELLEASEARSEALVSLAYMVKKSKELCHRLVSERDTILKALRSVLDVSERFANGGTPTPSAEEVDRVYREAIELVKVIDQLQAKQAKVDAGLPPLPGPDDYDGLPPVPGG
jgi:hypothetical protein